MGLGLFSHVMTAFLGKQIVTVTATCFLHICIANAQSPPYIPDECGMTELSDCVNDCSCAWCYSSEKCIPWYKLKGECQNNTAKPRDCLEKEKESSRITVVLTTLLILASFLVAIAAITVTHWKYIEVHKYIHRIKRIYAYGSFYQQEKAGYEHLLRR